MCLYSPDYTINHNEKKDENENISHRYDINRPRCKHGPKYSKYNTCLRMIMLTCTKQHLSNIWTSIHEKVKQYRGLVEKSVAYKKRVYCRSK